MLMVPIEWLLPVLSKRCSPCNNNLHPSRPNIKAHIFLLLLSQLMPTSTQMTNHVIGEEQEALFHSSPCALYYVESPSTTSHGNSHPSESTFLSPFPCETFSENRTSREVSRFTLSRYSSSRGSNNSFLHEKKVPYDVQSTDSQSKGGSRQVLRIVSGVEVDDSESGGRRSGLWKFLSLDLSSSCCCIMFQVIWRLVMSMACALLVFFLATKPPAPKVSFKIGRMEQFSLGEGLDNTGVITKILSCNCSVDMEIDNYSKVFGLHIRPSSVEMAFGRMVFASSQGEESYVDSQSSMALRLYVATKNKPMYGAGRTMQDKLESGQGLPIAVHVRARSSYRVVWNLIKPRYHHHAECLLIILRSAFYTQIYNSTCSVVSYHG